MIGEPTSMSGIPVRCPRPAPHGLPPRVDRENMPTKQGHAHTQLDTVRIPFISTPLSESSAVPRATWDGQ